MNFHQINNKQLDALDLVKYSNNINSLEHKQYFLDKSGSEHYRLLAYISQNNFNINILDVGTLKGCSALAFSINESNKVHSFNIVNHLDLSQYPNNIKFIIDNILNNKYKNLILNSHYILLDTDHDGVFEKQFYEYLIYIKYKGYLLLDDIYLNPAMLNFWHLITQEKYDISSIGHSTGTGVVYFD
jgi:hypothetical protein